MPVHARSLGGRAGDWLASGAAASVAWTHRSVAGDGSIQFQEMIKLDYRYLANWSLWNDVKLLLRTVPSACCGRAVCNSGSAEVPRS